MSNKKTEDLVNALSELTVLEMAELKTLLEDKWGVKAAAPVAVAAGPAAGPAAEAAVESTDFLVTLTEAPADKKIGIIKVVREITGLGLKEAKELVEAAPKELKPTAPKAEAEDIKKKVEAAGGKVTLKGL
ncbi:50S ribosomal protein L7/L12 [Candidatus Protochlamydia naegleriophila]|uniref:Large ribosomal subunit protein bL12 n=1 Tax=Candidatus Protochlamydia naegleriophila TaxID=389348 RepID=A0A0U5JDT6_9BACT|nr:50S ribosomal protein L7/L12 [Candidatus Protochlamydia naegleriophila]CUI17319.1 50S ribosomal protein L7/L12 [Candidatus Protochlamydia naegleriophila]